MRHKFNYANAVQNLRRLLGENPKKVIIYTSCDHVSKSGMSRQIKAFVIIDNQPFCIGHGRVSGGGMDMGFHVAETCFSLAYPNIDYRDFLTHQWL